MTRANKPLRTQVIEHVGKFSLGSFAGAVGNFLTHYFAALLLGPATWGVWQGARLVLDYGQNLHLGVVDAMHRELPLLRGRGDLEGQKVVAGTTFMFMSVVGLVATLGVLMAALTVGGSFEWRLTLAFIAPLLLLQLMLGYYGILFKAQNQFEIAGWMAVLGGVTSAVGILLIFPFQLTGFLIGQVFSWSAVLAFCLWVNRFPVSLLWSWSAFRGLLRVGTPIMLLVLSATFYTTTDRLLILKYLGHKELAYYSLGKLVFSPFNLIFSAGSNVVYTRFTERFGRTGNPRELLGYITEPTQALALAMSLAAGLAVITLPFLVHRFLPEYAPGIDAARILVFGLTIFYLGNMGGNMLLTINRHPVTLVLLLLSAGVALGLGNAFLAAGHGIAGVAVAVTVAGTGFMVACNAIAMRYAGATPGSTLLFLVNVLAPIAGVALAVAAMEGLSLFQGLGPFGSALSRSLLLLVAFAYPLLVLKRRLIRNGR